MLAPPRKPSKAQQQMATDLDDLSKQFQGFQEMMKQALDELTSLKSWRGAVDETMGTMLLKADATSARLLRLEHMPPPAPTGLAASIDLNAAPIGSLRPSSSTAGVGLGNDARAPQRVEGGGALRSSPQLGAGSLQEPSPRCDGFERESGFRHSHLPKMEFPKFDGTNPRLWKENCERYFEVYSVVPFLRTRFAAMNFIDSAAIWLQTEERHGRIQEWDELVKRVFAKYDQDQYPIQLRQLDSLKQLGSVQEFQKHFEELAHGILLYYPSYDDTFFVTRFLGGLKEEIRSAIALHRPKTVQAASELALLQELELEMQKPKLTHKVDSGRYQGKQTGNVEKIKPVPRKEGEKGVETGDKVASL